MNPPEECEYAIVGGGIAGLYAAHRLSRAGLRNVHVFEATPITGGRLLSVDMPGAPFRAELGGMRFLDRHLLLNELVRSLSLGTRSFGFAGTKKLMYLRGCHIREGDDCNYKLDRAERGMRCDELVTHAIRSALRDVKLDFGDESHSQERRVRLADEIARLEERLRLLAQDFKDPDEDPALDAERAPGEKRAFGIDYFTARQWELIKRFGRLQTSPLYRIGFWNLLQHYLSSDGFLFLHDALGYESIVLNWNAAEAMQWFLRDFSGSYLTLVNGMQILTHAIHRKQEGDERGTRFSFRHKLVSVEFDPANSSAPWTLHFKVQHPNAVGGLPMDQERTVRARNVILALPAEALRELTIPVLAQPPVSLPRLLNKVKAQRLFKLFLAYEQAWWNDPRGIGGMSGTANTDLPIRQVYYWGPDKATDSATTQGMLMASYSDSHYVDFWEPLHRRPEKKFYHRLGREPTPAEESYLLAYGVSENMVAKAHRQIRMLHPELSMADRIPMPTVALVKDWPGGWHAWCVHAKPWLVMKQLKRPMQGQNLYICGEAYSEDQGWVEGALRSVELALREMKIDPPGISAEDYRRVGYDDYASYVGDWGDLD